MYSSQVTVKRIKQLIKEQGVSQKELLAACGMSINALNQASDSKGIASFSLARIADYLNVSTDYLLGRTNSTEYKNADSDTARFAELFESLSADDKVKTIAFMIGLKQ